MPTSDASYTKRKVAFSNQAFWVLVLIQIASMGFGVRAQGSITVVGAKYGEPLEASPAVSLSAERLEAQRSQNLGETLSLLPGMSHSAFGPHASRPVVRGLDRDRVRIMQAGSTISDLSSFSSDHAVAIDPMLIESVEILRGPSALLYGGQASGAAINLIDKRLTRRLTDSPEAGFEGVARLQADDQSGGRQYGVIMRSAINSHPEQSNRLSKPDEGAWILHLDASSSKNEAIRTPSFTVLRDGGTAKTMTRIQNSAAEQSTAGLGFGWVDRNGHVGLVVDRVEKNYGVTVEEATTIEMERQTERFEAVRKFSSLGGIKVLLNYARTSYRHDEKEDGEVTRFKVKSQEFRSELHYGRAQSPSGLIGIESSDQQFSAVDDKGQFAFVPPNQTARHAVFWLQRLPVGLSEWQFAARQEKVRVEPETQLQEARKFQPLALSLSYSASVTKSLRFQASLSKTERAPTSYELLADGIHHAAGTYEKGDIGLGHEKGILGDLSLHYESAVRNARISVFQNRYLSYIGLKRDSSLDTEHDDEAGEILPGYRYASYAARLQGLEFSGSQVFRLTSSELRPSIQFDLLRGVDMDTGLNLPRMAPRRWVLSAAWSGELVSGHRWLIRPEWVIHASAKRSIEDEISGASSAPANQLFHLYAQLFRRFDSGLVRESVFYLQAKNLTNQLAYYATALPNIRDLAPYPGRTIKLGWILRF